jgi:hypothetical protein
VSHTPTPWINLAGTSRALFTEDGQQIAFFPITDLPIKEAAANEAFARVAVNSHDALVEALRGAIGALEFSRDYHKDLGNEEQAFAQDRLDAAIRALEEAK